jgi:hypothetical protein
MGNLKGFQVRLSAATKKDVRLFYSRGMPLAEIREQFGISQRQLMYIVEGLALKRDNWIWSAAVARLRLCSDLQLGWIAGIVDGEGWIGLNSSTSSKTYVDVRIAVTSTTVAMQNALLKLTGLGTVHDQKPAKPNHRPQFTWRVQSALNVGAFLEVVSPYLLIKRAVAKVVLDVCVKRIRPHEGPVNVSDVRTKVRALNKKGRP